MRLESQEGISYTEFSYQLLQGMDFLELYRRYGCTLQQGGSDQWGNLTAGIDLIHRLEPGAHVHALATPLMVKADGTKFGKSESGAVWLDPEMTTPYAFYQFWLNVDDRDISTYMRILSFKSREELDELEKLTEERPQARSAQRSLAEELTTLVHGGEQCAAVIAASKALFGQGELGELDEATLSAALSEVPHARVTELGPVVDLLVEVGLSASKSAARRTVKEGGAYVNNAKVTDGESAPAQEELLHGRWLVLRRGKKNLAAVEVVVELTPAGAAPRPVTHDAWPAAVLRRRGSGSLPLGPVAPDGLPEHVPDTDHGHGSDQLQNMADPVDPLGVVDPDPGRHGVAEDAAEDAEHHRQPEGDVLLPRKDRPGDHTQHQTHDDCPQPAHIASSCGAEVRMWAQSRPAGRTPHAGQGRTWVSARGAAVPGSPRSRRRRMPGVP